MTTFPVTRHRVWQLAADAVLIAGAWWLASSLLQPDRPVLLPQLLSWGVIAVVIAIKLGVFVVFGFYNRWWRYVSTRDMWRAFQGVTAACLVCYLALLVFPPHDTAHLPKRIIALDYLLLLAFVAGTRLLARTILERPRGGLVSRGKEVLIVGGGDAGRLILREMQRNQHLAHADQRRRRRARRTSASTARARHHRPAPSDRDHRPEEVLIAMPSAGRPAPEDPWSRARRACRWCCRHCTS
jgi:FlaA1/EpsC-like NDP-sugar epimerase